LVVELRVECIYVLMLLMLTMMMIMLCVRVPKKVGNECIQSTDVRAILIPSFLVLCSRVVWPAWLSSPVPFCTCVLREQRERESEPEYCILCFNTCIYVLEMYATPLLYFTLLSPFHFAPVLEMYVYSMYVYVFPTFIQEANRKFRFLRKGREKEQSQYVTFFYFFFPLTLFPFLWWWSLLLSYVLACNVMMILVFSPTPSSLVT